MIRRVLVWLFEIGLYIVTITLMYLLLFADNGVRFFTQISRLKNEQSQELLVLQNKQHMYERHTKLLREDREYFDKEVRAVWSMVKPDEIVILKKDLKEDDIDENDEYK